MIEDELALFDKSINEFWNKFKSTLSDTSCQMMGLRDTYKDSIKALTEKLSVKLKEEERMVEMFLEYQNQICRRNKLIQEKKDNLLRLIAEIKDKNEKLEVLTANIQDLKEEYARKKETISAANKANEEKLKRLQTSADLYKDRLGLEIRKIYVSDSAPHLECLAEFQEKVRKTNNFSAFLANVRKAFTAMVYN
ncbi:kinetochore protein Spc25 isoform X2 [Prionailurus viverrinus]|uniref:kinetochore protein Spc25 isoform X2 n=1 Tax=Prionailurus viverrinus TaxID=61388 RepID=UPI001FF21D07|nr:kinetochore protein Spc25 isoform X2 [Prionailurus viverrinus]